MPLPSYLKKVTGVLSVTVLAFSFLSLLSSSISAQAAGVNPTITPGTSAVSTAATISIAYTAGVAMPIGSTIAVTYNSGYTGTLSTANTTINTAAPSAVNNTVAGPNTVSTLTLSAAVTAGATVTIAITGLTSPVTAGNYAFLLTSSTGDFGGNFQYVGEANVVNVRALVPISLSFVIRDNGDAANTNICDLGTAATTAVSTCSYRLKIGTNATNGYVVSMRADGQLTNGTANMTDAAAGATGTNVVAGTETYGATITPGAITTVGGTITAPAAYNAGATNAVAYSNTGAATLLTSNKPNSPAASGDTTNTSLVTHKLGISSDTGAGLYTQKVTYTVAPAF